MTGKKTFTPKEIYDNLPPCLRSLINIAQHTQSTDKNENENKSDNDVSDRIAIPLIILVFIISSCYSFVTYKITPQHYRFNMLSISFIIGSLFLTFGKGKLVDHIEAETLGYVVLISSFLMLIGISSEVISGHFAHIIIMKDFHILSYAIGFGLFFTIFARVIMGSNCRQSLFFFLRGRDIREYNVCSQIVICLCAFLVLLIVIYTISRLIIYLV